MMDLNSLSARPLRDDFQSLGELMAAITDDLQFRRNVERIHALGPRAVGELLGEIAAERAIYHIINRKLARYAALSQEALSVTGGDRFPPVLEHGGRP